MARVARRNVTRHGVARRMPPGVGSPARRLPMLRESAGEIARYTSMMPCTWWM